MKLYPAIDLKNNQCVRLKQGKFDQVTVYENSPEKMGKQFIEAGATYLHIIDLDGAEQSEMKNLNALKTLLNLNVPIQVGGGIRTLKTVKTLIDIGVSRVLIGTMAIEDEALLKTLLKQYPNKIVVSIDAFKGHVKTRGWLKDANIDAITLAKRLESFGLKTIVYTDIEKDGMMEGLNIGDYKRLKEATNLDIIAAGGVSEMEDIKQLKSIGIDGAIIGKALYEKTIDLKEAIACLQDE